MDNWQKRVFPKPSQPSPSPLSELGRSKNSNCHRCGKIVYVTEKIKISHNVCFHPNCFRCLRCENRLTLQSFKTFTDEGKVDFYCEHHVPLYPGHLAGTDHWGEAGIKQALASQEDVSVYHSTLDLAGHQGLDRRQRRALEKRLTYNRRVCKSLSRLNNSYDDFRWVRSLSNSCDTLSAFSCDDACSDILYFPAGYVASPVRTASPLRAASPSSAVLEDLHDDNYSPVPHFRRHNFPTRAKSPSDFLRTRQTTFSDRVEVIHLSASSSASDEEKANEKEVEEVFDAPNPFQSQSNDEIAQYVKEHLPQMSSLSSLQSDLKFADDSSEDSEKSGVETAPVFAEPSRVLQSSAVESASERRSKVLEMRRQFLSDSARPVIQIVPPTPPILPFQDSRLASSFTPPASSPVSQRNEVHPPTSTLASQKSALAPVMSEALASTASSLASSVTYGSTSTTTDSDSDSSSSSGSSSDSDSSESSSDSESNDGSPFPAPPAQIQRPVTATADPPTVTIAASPQSNMSTSLSASAATTSPTERSARPSTISAAAPSSAPTAAKSLSFPTSPGFVSGVLPKPVAMQFPPRPSRPPPPPPVSASSSNSTDRRDSQNDMGSHQGPPQNVPTVLLETDLDAFIDPSLDDIMNDPLRAPVGRIEVFKESTSTETTTTVVRTDPSLPGGSLVTKETIKSVHAPKPVIKFYKPLSASSNPSSTESLDILNRNSPQPLLTPIHQQAPAAQEITLNAPTPVVLEAERESELSIYVPPAPAPIFLPSQEDEVEVKRPEPPITTSAESSCKRTALVGSAYLRQAPEKEDDDGDEKKNPHLLTAPTWERVRHESSDSHASSNTDKSTSETEFPPDLHAEDPTYLDFSLTTSDFDGPEAIGDIVDAGLSVDDSKHHDGHDNSSSSTSTCTSTSDSSSDSSSDSDEDEEVYDPHFTPPSSSSLPNLLDEADGEFSHDDEWDDNHGISDSQVIQISSISELAKFSAKHTNRKAAPIPRPPAPSRHSQRIVIPKGPARTRHMPVVPAVNFLTVRRSPRLLRKGMTGSLPVIFERPESFGEKDGKKRPDFLLRGSNNHRASPEVVSSAEDSCSTPSVTVKTAPAAAPVKSTPEPAALDAIDLTPLTNLALDPAEAGSTRTLSDADGEMMTTDLDDLSPVESVPKSTELHETDLDELMRLNEDHVTHTDPFETAIDDDTNTPSMGENNFEDECTTSQSSGSQLGEMDPGDEFPELEVEDEPPVVSNVDLPDLTMELPTEVSLEPVSPSSQSSSKPGIRSMLASFAKKRNSGDFDEPDVAPSRPSIRSMIADLEKRTRPNETSNETTRPTMVPKPRIRHSLSGESTSEKENSQRSEKPSSVSPRPVLKNLPQEVTAATEKKVCKVGSAKGEVPEYMNDYVPALMSQVSSAQIPTEPTVIDVYPVYQQTRSQFPPRPSGQQPQQNTQSYSHPTPPQQFQSHAGRGPPPPLMPKPNTKPPLMPKPKVPPKPSGSRPPQGQQHPSHHQQHQQQPYQQHYHHQPPYHHQQHQPYQQQQHQQPYQQQHHQQPYHQQQQQHQQQHQQLYQQQQQQQPYQPQRGSGPPPTLPAKPSASAAGSSKPFVSTSSLGPSSDHRKKSSSSSSSSSGKASVGAAAEGPSPLPAKSPVSDSVLVEAHPSPDTESAVLEMVQDVVQGRKPWVEDEEQREQQRLDELKKKREEERSRADAHEALRSASKYQRANEIAGNIIEMDRAIDAASGHINCMDDTVDKISDFNRHLMLTLEGMSDGEISDVEMDDRSVQVQTVPIAGSRGDPRFGGSTENRQDQLKVPPGVSVAGTPSAATATAAANAAAAAAAMAKQQGQGAKTGVPPTGVKPPAGSGDKPWENCSLSSDSSSSSGSSSSSSSSYTSSSEEEGEKEETMVASKPTPTLRSQAPGSRGGAPVESESSKLRSRLTKEQLENPFRTRGIDPDQHSIASSTLSHPERLPLPMKVERMERKMAGGGHKYVQGPLPPPRNPFMPIARSHEPAVPSRDSHYENTAHTKGVPTRNPKPKPRRPGGSSGESIDSSQHRTRHGRHRRRSQEEDSDGSISDGEGRRHGRGHRKGPRGSDEVFAERHGRHHHGRHGRTDNQQTEDELHYAASQMDLYNTTPAVPPQFANPEMEQDADRKAEHETRIRTIERMQRQQADQRNGEPDSFFYDTSSTLTRRRAGTGPKPSGDDPHRRSMPYRESDDEDNSQAERSRFGGKVGSLFKKKRPGDKDRRGLNKAGTIEGLAGRSSTSSGPIPNPHRRSQSVDARTRKQQRGAKSSESLLPGPGVRNSRARSSERRPRTPVGFGRPGEDDDDDDEDEWQPTMTDDELDSEYRRRSTGDAFYLPGDAPTARQRPIKDAYHRAQSEDHLGRAGSGGRRRGPPPLPSRESAAYFDYDSDDSFNDNDSDFDSPRIEKGGTGGYVNLPPARHGRSKSYDMLQDAHRPPKGRDDGLPGRLHRGYPGKSGPGSMASSMMSVGDVRDKDLSELTRMLEDYLGRGRLSKARTLMQALMLEDRNKVQQLLARLPGFREELQELCQRWQSTEMGTDRRAVSSDLLLSTLLLHDRQAGGNLMPAPSQGTILRTVYMRPDDVEEPPPGMRPPPRPVPPAMKKASLISDELKRIDALAEEVTNYDQTTFKELMAVLLHECQTEVEKVRALYCWLTAKDINRLDFDPYAPPESLLGMLRRVKHGEISYHDLFQRLCHYCGIHCEIIFGYSKGAGYRAGMNLKDTRMFESSWTAVYVANSWRFINVAWGSPRNRASPMGEALGTTAVRPGMRDEFYFLTDPEEHIFEHMPYKKRWQLMKKPITLEQFMSLPVLKSAFFNADLSLKKRYSESLTTKEGRVTVRLVMPRFVGISCTLENRADMTELKGLTLVRVMGEEVAILATPSQPGRFYLNIFISSPEDWKDTTTTLAASFQIRCSEHNYDRLVVGRFPPIGFLGRTPASQKFGVSVVGNPDPLIVWNEKGVVRIPLAVAPGLKLMHRMKCFERHGKDSRDCQEYALVQTRSKRTAYCLRCPADGYYFLTLYAGLVDNNENNSDLITEGLECVHSFLVDCRRQMTGAPPFPLQTSRWNGCYLAEPTHRLLEVNRKYTFRVEAPHCSIVAVVVNGRNWLDLKRNKAGQWTAKIFTGEELGELSVYGQFSSTPASRRQRHEDIEGFEDEADGREEENYDKLLDFEIVMRQSCR